MKIVRLTQARIVNSIVFVFLSATILSFITTTFAKDKKPTPARPSTQVGEVKGKGNFGIVCNPYNEDWEDPEKTINLLKELGVKLVVSRILWNDIEEKKGKFSKDFILWPFVHIQDRDLDTDSPSKYFAMLPFYVSNKSNNIETKSILWPFFNYSEDKRNNFTLRDAPWPFYQRGKGDNIDILRIFPIYGYKYKEDVDSYYILWPIYQYKREYPEDYENISHSFLIIDRYKKEIWKKENKKAKSIWIWPLFSYKYDKENSLTIHFPELLPVDEEGLERNYGPLLRIYDYNKNEKGDMELRILWGLYSNIKKNSKETISLSFLINYEKGEKESKFSILKGLFEIGKIDNDSHLKIFYIKIQ